MSVLDDRERLLEHMHECVRCPTDPCDKGLELAAAVRDGIYGSQEFDKDWGKPGWYERALADVRKYSTWPR